jgi:hypothetical protein
VLAEKYLAAVAPFNETLRRVLAVLDSSTSQLAQRKAAAGEMAAANWTLIVQIRLIRKTVEMPELGYPTDASFYTDLDSGLGEMIDRAISAQDGWTRLRDARTSVQFNDTWTSPTFSDDGNPQRRVRSLLGLPDIPTS